MDDFPRFAVWALYVAFIVWAAVAADRAVTRHRKQQAEIRRLTEREAALAAELARQRERNHELATARDFADSDQSGYVDRTGLEA